MLDMTITTWKYVPSLQGQAGCTLPPKALPEVAVALEAGEGSA